MATSNNATYIREYRKGDGRQVSVAYLQGVILQDNTFNYNGQCLFIGSGGKQGCDASDLFVEDEKTCRMVYRDGSPACSECGRELDYDSRFCDGCGAKVASGSERKGKATPKASWTERLESFDAQYKDDIDGEDADDVDEGLLETLEVAMKGCKFCKEEHPFIDEAHTCAGTPLYYGMCPECGACGPVSLDPAEAVSLWNWGTAVQMKGGR